MSRIPRGSALKRRTLWDFNSAIDKNEEVNSIKNRIMSDIRLVDPNKTIDPDAAERLRFSV